MLPSPRSRGVYKPPESYWREVDSLDAQIYELGKPLPVTRALGFIAIHTRRALWAGPEEHRGSFWQQSRLGSNSATKLITGEFINVDPASEGMETDSYMIGRGFYATTYEYNTGSIIHKRILNIDYGYVTDLKQPDNFKRNRESKLLDERVGLHTPDQEAYDRLLDELRRGALGDFGISQELP